MERAGETGGRKFVDKYTLGMKGLLDLISIAEFQDLRIFFRENLKIKKKDHKKRGFVYKIAYSHQSMNTTLEKARINDIHYRNYFLSDFSFEFDQDGIKFFIKVK